MKCTKSPGYFFLNQQMLDVLTFLVHGFGYQIRSVGEIQKYRFAARLFGTLE
jgi:hypothetical protein